MRRRPFSRTLKLKNKVNETIARYWSYKLLIEFELLRQLIKPYIDDSIIEFLDISSLYKNDKLKVSKKTLFQEIKQKFEKMSTEYDAVDHALFDNIKRISRVITLNQHEEQILLFIIILKNSVEFLNLTDELGDLSLSDVYGILSCLLDIPFKNIKVALNPDSTLLQSGLIRIDRDGPSNLQYRLDLMQGLDDALLLPETNVNNLFSCYFSPTEKSRLNLKNFDYLFDQIQLILNLLSSFKKKPTEGINILLYGPPGTGKTELARVIGQEVKFKLNEVSMKNDEGEAIIGDERFSSYCLAQYVLKNNLNELIIFDEIEDVFPSPFFSMFTNSKNSSSKKAWINRLLETNKVPTIWISNNVDQIDEAFKRRFKLIMKIDIPPQRTRLKIIKNSMECLPVSSDWLENLSQYSDISPALITQTAEVISLMSHQTSDSSKKTTAITIEKNMTQVLNNTLECMGKRKISNVISGESIHYNPDVLNADTDILELIHGLKSHQHGRLCLYGPPGTGKTAFGHYIASELDKKLLVKRASNILSPYVGEAEMNIANMFEQAKRDNAVLLLDEADSFLMDRKRANHSWEVTQVNELLTQMEAFEGLFVCSTNLMDNLDEASIRRFDLKIKMDYLQPEQVWLMFQQVLSERNEKISRKKWWKQQLAIFNNLTPGDFATVVRQNRLSSHQFDANKLYEGIKSESLFKSDNKRSIGFMAAI